MAKIRNHRKMDWRFFPSEENEKHFKKISYSFRYKSDLMRFLNSTFPNCLNGTVSYDESSFAGYYSKRYYSVWFNSYTYYNKDAKLAVVLKLVIFRGKKERTLKATKGDKKYFAFSRKIISLMCKMREERTEKDAKKLLGLFIKRGFKDFTPKEEEQDYIENYIKEGIPYYYWSDRCNWMRTKAVIESLKREGLLK